MQRMNQNKILESLAQLGYPLIEPENKVNPNELLAALVEGNDSRILEGFPVVLANCIARKDSGLDLDRAVALVTSARQELFWQMVALSNILFDIYGLDSLLIKPGEKGYETYKKAESDIRKCLLQDSPVKLKKRSLDPQRLKKIFLDYVASTRMGQHLADSEKSKIHEEFKREYNLSLLLSPRQKDILYKRMRGEVMTKTEREYFSRVIKKRLVAIADPGLQDFVQRVLK